MEKEQVIFKSLKQLFWFLQACLFYEIEVPMEDGKQTILRIIMSKLLKLNKDVITLNDIMRAMPGDMQINQPNCQPNTVIPIILAICKMIEKLPDDFHCSYDITGEKPAMIQSKGEGVWDILYKRFPKPKDFFEWLKNFKPTGEMTGANWSQAYDSFESDLKKLGYKEKHPLDLLKDALPIGWNGITKIEQNDIRITREGLPALLIKFIIPALLELLKQTGKR